MKKGIFLLAIIFLLLQPACKKDELTRPARVFFEYELISHDEDNNLKSGPPFPVPFNRLTIDNGSLTVSSLEFEGRRDEGKDVFFISSMRQPLVVDLETGKGNQLLIFDIPQGVYNFIEINLNLGGNDGIPLILEGKINSGTPNEIHLRFEHDIFEKIRIRAESVLASTKIVLRKDTPSKAKIVLDSRYVFQFVNVMALRDADISIIDGKEVILINSLNNINIFNRMAERLEKSFSVIFD
jgi:hypothetical protein